MLDLCSFVWPVRKIVNVMRDHGFCGGFLLVWKRMEENVWKRSWPNFHSVYQLQKCSVRAWSNVSRSLTLPKWNCLQLRMNRVCKTAVSLDTYLVVVANFGHHHLEYFIQDVDGDVFDRVIGHVRVSANRSPKKEFYWGNCKKSPIFFCWLMCV